MKTAHDIVGNTVWVYVNSKTYGEFTIFIDLDDLPRFNDATIGIKNKNGKIYAIVTKGKVQTLLHRFILNYTGKLIIDHINRDTLDNRKTNLRLGTQALNVQNRSTKNGLLWNEKLNKWQACVGVNGKYVLRKHFTDKDEAIRAIEEAREKFHEWAPK